MKSKISFSRFSTILTITLNTVLLICCILTFDEKPIFYPILSIFVILFVAGLLYAPISIKADSRYITIASALRSRKLTMCNVASVELFQPTMGAYRIFASGGYMGYWGIFKEGDIGRYAAYYGKASDCFLVRMTNGDKYVLGCANPSAMVNYIKSQIDKK